MSTKCLFISSALSLSLLLAWVPMLTGTSQAASIAPQATVTRVTGMRVSDYRPVLTVAYHITDTLAGSLPNPFNWYLENFDPNRLSNLTVGWAGGGNCVTHSNHNNNCTRTNTHVEPAYSFNYTPTLYGANLHLGWSGATSFATDYTITVSYPDPLVYVSSPVSPPIPNGHQLTWH